MCLLTTVGGHVALSLDAHLWLGSPHLQYLTDFLLRLFFFFSFFVELIVITD